VKGFPALARPLPRRMPGRSWWVDSFTTWIALRALNCNTIFDCRLSWKNMFLLPTMRMTAAVTSVPGVWFLTRKFYWRLIACKSNQISIIQLDFEFEWKCFSSFFVHVKNVCVWNVAFVRAGWGDEQIRRPDD
jgi:hypothetical protein